MVLGTDIKTKEFYNLGTDVIARGIHVEGITHIINYDLPETLEIIFIVLEEQEDLRQVAVPLLFRLNKGR